jgi:hypothetical protein
MTQADNAGLLMFAVRRQFQPLAASSRARLEAFASVPEGLEWLRQQKERAALSR